MFRQDPAALIKAVVDTLPAALLLVDHEGQVQDIFVSNRRLRYFRERDLRTLLGRFLFSQTVDQIIRQFEQVIALKKAGNVPRISFHTCHGTEEHAACYITPLSETGVAILFLNTSDVVLLEQEFQSFTEQAEASQQELCKVLSTMEFRLMDLDQAHKRLQVLYQVASIVERNVSEQEALDDIVGIVMSEFSCVNVAIFLLNSKGDMLMMKANCGYSHHIDTIPVDSGIIGHAFQTREQVFVADVLQDLRYIPGAPDCVSELAIPLIVRDQVIGVLDLQCSAEHSLSPYDIEMLRTLAAQAAVVIAHIQYIALIEKVAITDELTKLYNFHHFRTLLEQEYHWACRYHHALSLLMIDIDYFKRINDSFGHVTGNEILAQVAKLLSQSCRNGDWVCRYGGEEFAVLLPETDFAEAYRIAEQIRQVVADYSFDDIVGCAFHLSISVGVTSLSAGLDTAMDLVAQADQALLDAKRTTRNCVRVYSVQPDEA